MAKHSRLGTKDRKEMRKLLRARDGDVCFLCAGDLDFAAAALSGEFPTIEHKRAVSAGGSNEINNLALAHRRCNEARGDKPLGTVMRKMRRGPLPNPVLARACS